MYKIGVDEAGRGSLLGPIVACSLTFDKKNMPSDQLLEKITDSKKLTAEKRKEIFKELIRLSSLKKPKVYFGIGVVDNFLVDETNVKQANKEAIRRSLIELLRKIDKDKVSLVLIDGNDNYEFKELNLKPIYIVGGDKKVLEIGAASIIAKVFRDELIKTYSKIYPNLGLESHKGYGTKKHLSYLSDKSKVTGIHRISYDPIKKALQKKEKLLLHVCCGPDASVPILDLKEKYDVVCFWYNPNIHPKKEYDKRLEAFKKVCKIEGVNFVEGEYDVKNFFESIKGFESTPEKGKKCERCYKMRLKRSALEARKLGIKYLTSSLLTSPLKDIKKIFNLGDRCLLGKNLEFLKIAFRRNNGFLRSVEYCKKYGIYRQSYCGCVYSDTFPGKKLKASVKLASS